MTKQLVGLLQVAAAVSRKYRMVDVDVVARVVGESPEDVLRSLRKLARWGLVDSGGRVTALGEWLTVRVRTPGAYSHELLARQQQQAA